MLSRSHSIRICTCVQFLHSADVVAYVVVRQEWVQMSILWIADVRQWVVAELERPLQAQVALKSQDARSAYPAEGSGLPIQVAKDTPWEFGAALGNAACRGEVCKASTAAGGLHMLGSSARRLMDSVVAPYHRVLALERRVDTNVECNPETTLIEPTKDSDCSLNWG